ncbi:hypothetical protein [Pseudomonas gingeri]|uniref:Uncharacterized protein n=1 Tax=Pseudomonas gingeri TaxID=117681 RepID=A0A7Y8BNM4_9PSED|nr:hypothetical protein [Pseudomonas gingeri]NWB49843.1 hypothetical protein [Pseudomonas gingeri]
MLTVRYLRPEPSVKDWVSEHQRLLVGLLLWAFAMLWVAGAGQNVDKSGWYTLTAIEGALVLTQMISEDACKANVLGGALACVSGGEWVGNDPE